MVDMLITIPMQVGCLPRCNEMESGVLVSIGEVNASKLGTYTLSYSYTDAANNVAQSVTRTVSVVDTTAPIIT